MRCLFLFLILYPEFIYSQSVSEVIEQVYQRAQEQKNQRESMGDYVYRQSVHFTKLDGDGEIDEQSKRIFQVYVRPPDQTKRVLISAENYEDGEWTDVTMDERKKNRGTESQQFSLLEMVAPDAREKYMFSMQNSLFADSQAVYLIGVTAKEKDEDYFDGELWIAEEDYSLIRAVLTPSDMPTGLDSMRMSFDLHIVEGYWLPESVTLEAYISFLFIFKGQILTTIRFNKYKLNQFVPDTMFSN